MVDFIAEDIRNDEFYYLMGYELKLTLYDYERLIKNYHLTKEELLEQKIQGILEKIPESEERVRGKFEYIAKNTKKLIDLIPKVKNDHASLLEKSISVISYYSQHYPRRLDSIKGKKGYSAPPFLLFYKGSFSNVNIEKTIAIIGPRKPSTYALESTRAISKRLAGKGFTIVSGLAQGIDTAAHRASIDEKGSTIAILGVGLNNIYPEENISLAEEIAKKGLLISEFGPYQQAKYWTFAKRNRIISGISLGTIIMEGTEKSGTRYGAELSMDLERPLFCLKPNNPKSALSYLPKTYLASYKKAHEITPDNAVEIILKVVTKNTEPKKSQKQSIKKDLRDFL